MMLFGLLDGFVGPGHIISHNIDLVELGSGRENRLGIERITDDILASGIQQRTSILPIAVIYFNEIAVGEGH